MISVVVCTFNRAETLRQMLTRFLGQDGLKTVEHELLVVDNNSTDGTAAVMKEFVVHSDIRYIFEGRPGLSFARNRGIAESQGSFIAFLDDDVIVDEKWLLSLEVSFKESSADVIGGRVRLRFNEPAAPWLEGIFRKCLSEVDLGEQRQFLHNGDSLYGANLSFKRRVFETLGAFDVETGRRGLDLLGGEETALLRRVLASGGKVLYDPAVLVHHIIERKRSQWSYFVAYARADGRTRELLEPKVWAGFQLLRVGNAAWMVAKAQFAVCGKCFFGSSAYDRRFPLFIFVRQWAYLCARFRRLLSARRRREGGLISN